MIMCRVTINLNESAIRKWYPNLSTQEDLNRWAQREMDKVVKRLPQTAVSEVRCTYNSKAEVIAEAKRRVKDIESGNAELIPHEEVMQRMEKLIASYAN